MHSTGPTHRAGPDDAQLDGNEGDTHPEQTAATAREALLSGRWGLTRERVGELSGKCFFGDTMTQIAKLTYLCGVASSLSEPFSGNTRRGYWGQGQCEAAATATGAKSVEWNCNCTPVVVDVDV